MHVDVKLSSTGDLFEAEVDGRQAGRLEFIRRDGVITYTHTEVNAEFEGKGVGAVLVRTALDAARVEGVRVVPFCPFVKGWIRRHPEYADLVADA
ncbi:GNAT family N-acetyltransferase [Streptosporangium sp. NPDC004631]